MKKWGKKEIMEHLDSFITEDFECDHISVTFPNDNMVRIELTNDSDALVRCKDCKYWQTNTQFCTRWSAPFATQHTSPNWYCADGEPKDGDKE